MPNLHDRIRRARTMARLTQQELADRIGVHRSAVTQWESYSGSAPSMDHLIQIALHTGLALEWIGTGRGSPHAAGTQPTSSRIEQAQDELEAECLRSLRLMPRRLQERVVSMLSMMVRTPPMDS